MTWSHCDLWGLRHVCCSLDPGDFRSAEAEVHHHSRDLPEADPEVAVDSGPVVAAEAEGVAGLHPGAVAEPNPEVVAELDLEAVVGLSLEAAVGLSLEAVVGLSLEAVVEPEPGAPVAHFYTQPMHA